MPNLFDPSTVLYDPNEAGKRLSVTLPRARKTASDSVSQLPHTHSHLVLLAGVDPYTWAASQPASSLPSAKQRSKPRSSMPALAAIASGPSDGNADGDVSSGSGKETRVSSSRSLRSTLGQEQPKGHIGESQAEPGAGGSPASSGRASLVSESRTSQQSIPLMREAPLSKTMNDSGDEDDGEDDLLPVNVPPLGMASVPPLPRLVVDGPRDDGGASERRFPLEELEADEQRGGEAANDAASRGSRPFAGIGGLEPGTSLVPSSRGYRRGDASSLAPSSLAEDEVTVTPEASQAGDGGMGQEDNFGPGTLGPSRPDTGGTELPRPELGNGGPDVAASADVQGPGHTNSDKAAAEEARGLPRPSASSIGSSGSAVALDDGEEGDDGDSRYDEEAAIDAGGLNKRRQSRD